MAVTRSAIGTAAGRPLADAVTQGRGASLSAFSAAKYAIQQGAADVNILVVGDSTGNDSTEWVYLFGQWLESEYPTHAVSYRLWNDAGGVYDAAVSLGTGSGARTIRLWNASVSGTKPIHLMGSNFAAAITAPTPDLIIWNHGHNLVTESAISDALTRGGFLGPMDQVRQALPNVPHAAIRQNPNRDDSAMAPIVSVLDGVAASYGDLRLIDAYSPFIAAGKPAGWYTDSIHPNATGQAAFLDAVTASWRSAGLSAGFDPVAAFLSTAGTNLLSNSNFATGYAGGTPSGWTTSNATCTVDTTIKDAGKSQSMKVVGTVAGSAIFFPILSGVAGKTYSLAVRQYVPAGSASTVGRIAILYNNGANVITTTTSTGNVATGGFRWLVISGLSVPSDATFIRAYLYCDSAANASSAAYYDRAVLVEGTIPRDG